MTLKHTYVTKILLFSKNLDCLSQHELIVLQGFEFIPNNILPFSTYYMTNMILKCCHCFTQTSNVNIKIKYITKIKVIKEIKVAIIYFFEGRFSQNIPIPALVSQSCERYLYTGAGFISDPTMSPLIYTFKKWKRLEEINVLRKEFWGFCDMTINNDVNLSKIVIYQCLRNFKSANVFWKKVFKRKIFQWVDTITLKGLCLSKQSFTSSKAYLWNLNHNYSFQFQYI